MNYLANDRGRDAVEKNTGKSPDCVITGPFHPGEAEVIKQAILACNRVALAYPGYDALQNPGFVGALPNTKCLLLSINNTPLHESTLLRRAIGAGVKKIGLVCLVNARTALAGHHDLFRERRIAFVVKTSIVDELGLPPGYSPMTIVATDIIRSAQHIAKMTIAN
jgi:hypothetical protein